MTFSYEHAFLKTEEAERAERVLAAYLDELARVSVDASYGTPESSMNLPFDTAMHGRVQSLAKEKGGSKLKYVLVVGIGGSNLGTKALYDAFFGFVDRFEPKRFPKLIFIDTVDTEKLMMLRAFFGDAVKKKEEVIINVISKSGKTLETVANAEFIIHALRERYPDLSDRIVVTADAASPLYKMAEAMQLARLPIPEPVGGRYSVFSPVGLFPLYATGMNVRNLLAGARAMRDTCLEKTVAANPALASAAALWSAYERGVRIHDTFLFHPELQSLGLWYRQLLAESIGKEKNAVGEVVHAGITPTVSIGSTDLHSLGQLYLSGRGGERITTFVFANDGSSDAEVPSHAFFKDLIPGIEKLAMPEIMAAILGGVKRAYADRGLPFMEVAFRDMSLGSIGAYMQWKMMEVMFLGRLMGLNVFDQPNVESYKAETRNILGLK